MPDQIDGENYDATGSINIDVANYTENTSSTWIPTSNPILTSLQNIIMGSLSTLPRIRFGGDLTVAASVVLGISDMEFQHHTNTAINMNGGSDVTITGSVLKAHPCGKMWNGINVNNNNTGSATNLLMQKASGKFGAWTRLSDAIKGVYADEANSRVRIISKCQLFDNERSVVISNGNANNEFYDCFYEQLNPLRDQVYGDNNGYGSNKYGITGIELQNTSNTQNIGWAASIGNTFNGGQFAVDAANSNFNSYLNTVNSTKDRGMRSNAGFGSYNVNVQQSTFNNNNYDIDCFYGNNLTVQRSNFNNCAGHSISWNYNWNRKLIVGGDLTISGGTGTIADANTFTGCGWTAVRCLDNEAKFISQALPGTTIQVNYNTIQNAAAAGGVNISETSLTALGNVKTFEQFRIAYNTINNIADCITLQNIRGDIPAIGSTATYNGLNPQTEPLTANIDFNTISFSTVYNAGISAIKNYNSPQTKIFENSVTSDNSSNWQNIGIDVSDSPKSFVYKNTISAGRGLEARLDMTNGNYMCNDLNNCVIGIQLAWEWLRASDEQHGIPYIYNRRNNFTGSTGSDMECYYASPALNQWCNPFTSSIVYTGVSPSIIYESVSGNPVCYPCPTCRPLGGNTTATNQNQAAAKLGASSADMVKYNTYKTWADNFQVLNADKTAAIANLDLNDKQRLVNLVTVNEKLSERDYTAATAVLQNVTPGNVFENNLATVYSVIAAKKTENYRLANASEKTALIAIAEKHPMEAGPAVYNARVILKADYNLDFGWDDSTGVDPATANNRALALTSENAETELSIYPNPGTGLFKFTAASNNVYTYNVIDVLGVNVAKGEFTGSTELNLSQLPKGVYMVNFNNRTTGEISKKSLILSE